MLSRTKKRGVSPMISYILLISIAISLSVIVYAWIKTYAPRDAPACVDGVSLYVESATYDCVGKQLTLNIKNNGRFSVAGYFIYGSEDEDAKLAVIDLSSKNDGGRGTGGAVIHSLPNEKNPISPEGVMIDSFSGFTESLKFIEIMPARYQTQDNRNYLVTCSNARIKHDLECLP